MNQSIRVRYAPSPTGFLHIGGLRTALYNELFARRHGGAFILRIEDTDRTRFVEGGIENICRSLEACGIIPDEGVWLDKKGKMVERGEYGPYIQSARREKHEAYAEELIKMSKAYYCFCSAERLEKLRDEQQRAGKPTMYDGHCHALSPDEAESRAKKGEAHVVRLKLPQQGKVKIADVIHGDVEFDWSVVDDQVIIKSDGFPTYHLAATCDDHDMAITHVIRGDEWLASAPKHAFIYESFGWTAPQFAHLPLLLNPDRSKLSKRQGDVAVEDYLSKGILPEALLNFVALMGWNPSGEREIYTHEELAWAFDLTKVNKSGAVFNPEKLDWMNAEYLRGMSTERYLTLTHPYVADLTNDGGLADRALLMVRDRVTRLPDVADLAAPYFKARFDFADVSITWRTQPIEEAAERLKGVRHLIETTDEETLSDAEKVEVKIKALISEREWGNGDTLWPLRVALSGQQKSPTPFELIAMYGKQRALKRIDDALEQLAQSK